MLLFVERVKSENNLQGKTNANLIRCLHDRQRQGDNYMRLSSLFMRFNKEFVFGELQWVNIECSIHVDCPDSTFAYGPSIGAVLLWNLEEQEIEVVVDLALSSLLFHDSSLLNLVHLQHLPQARLVLQLEIGYVVDQTVCMYRRSAWDCEMWKL